MEKDRMMKVLQGQLQELMRNESHLSTKISSVHEDSLSFFGGKPFLPADFQWPRCTLDDDLPLAFLGQLNLADVAPFDTEGLLPRQGILSFFYELDTMEWGSLPSCETVSVSFISLSLCFLYLLSFLRIWMRPTSCPVHR